MMLLSEIHELARDLAAAGKRWDLVKPSGAPYLARYVLAGTTPAKDSPDDNSIWLHHLISPDLDPHTHNHPFEGVSVILHGSYIEQRGMGCTVRRAGEINRIKLGEFHRIDYVEPETWTMFYASRTSGRTWGFDIRGEFVQWKQAKDKGLIKTSDWVNVNERGELL